MAENNGKFHYSLQALLRKRRLELDTAMAELSEAQVQRERKINELGAARAALQELENLQRNWCQQGRSIDIDARMRIHLCIRSALLQVDERAKQLDQANARFEVTLGRVNAARRAMHALEDHRDSRRLQFEAARLRREHAAADELYLANQQARSAAGAIWQ